MTDAFYDRIEERTFAATEATRGPWAPDHQHAGPPAALLGGLLEGELTGGRVTRVTYEVLRPVRITTLHATTTLRRPGRRVAMAEGELADEDGPVLLARAWMIREADVELTPDRDDATLHPVDDAPPAPFFEIPWDVGYHTSMELRAAAGGFLDAGDAAVWFRSRLDVVAGEPITPLQRVLVAADSGNGISARLDPREWLFVNTDLTVHLREHPSGEWVGLDARTRWGPDGIGLATSTIHGEQGEIGVGAQGLIVEPHR